MPNLVGTGNNQVPTNAMLGGLAFQDTDHAVLKKAEIDKIAAIKTKIKTKWKYGSGNVADSTIRDIFVYDTRGDSDGGAWRKRTQNCSWYNETLNTAYRGSRKEFPSIAILVSHEGNNFGFSIYDGDDPNLPMWMHFPIDQYAPSSNWGSGIPFIGRANFVAYTAGPITALNGQIAMGNENTNEWQPGWMVNMISEKCIDVVNYGSATQQTYWMSSNISNRVNYDDFEVLAYNGSRYGTGDDHHSTGKSGITGECNNGEIRSISMKVTPDALIDVDTGLPVPTQAWAGKKGLSVMKGSSNAWTNQQYSNHTTQRATFTSKNDIVAISRNGGAPNAVVSETLLYPEYATYTTAIYHHHNLSQALDPTMGTVYTGLEDVKAMRNPYGGEDDLALIPSSNRGLNLYLGDGIDATAESKSTICARITPDYNTGWMMGSCNIAAMCDTSTATLGQSIHVDEGFDANGSWGFADNAYIGSSEMKLPNTNNARATHTTFLQANTRYMCRYLVNHNNAANWQFDDDGSGAGIGSVTVYQDITFNEDGTHSFVFETTASTRLRLMRTQTGSSATIGISYIRFYKIDRDTTGVLSPLNRAITIRDDWFGFTPVGSTIVRNSVSRTSASISPTAVEGEQSDVVAYSSWGSGSYLVRGYNADLDIGTNNFVAMGWVFPPTSSTSDQPLMGVGRADLNDGFLIYLNTGPYWSLDCGYLGVSNSFASSNGGTAVVGHMQGEKWNMFAIFKKGSYLRMYVNGQYVDQWGSNSINWSTKWTKKQIMTIGARAGQFGGGSSGGGSHCAPDTRMAMFRFGEANGNWNDDLFRMIYEDEKHLFVAGAKAVLTGGLGSSYRVKDIDYDTRTDTLHTASEYGTSEFKRLVRINNTTNPSSLVSAQGGMVSEINF